MVPPVADTTAHPRCGRSFFLKFADACGTHDHEELHCDVRPPTSDLRELNVNKFILMNMSTGASRPSNAVKDPDEWTTGDETMTGAQASYLQTLCDEAGEEFDPNLTKAEASKRIDELREKTGRGIDH